jgi:putative ABC transport system permease protein
VLRAELRGLLSRKLRLGLTAFAIALGVTLMAGTYIFTDTINSAFETIFQRAQRGTDVSLTPRAAFGSSTDPSQATLSLPQSLVARVRAVPGVSKAEGQIFSPATIFDRRGDKLGGELSQSFVASRSEAPFSTTTAVQGRRPRTAGEVALDKAAVDRAGFHLGDRVSVQGSAARKAYRLVGVLKIAGIDSLGNTSIAVLVPREAQRVVAKPHAWDSIAVAADAATKPATLRARIRGAIPDRAVNVRTGEQQAQQDSVDLRKAISPLRTALLAFAFIALFVGAFIIFNTFSITVAQRTREFGLLRMLGASRAQVLRSVVLESAALGLAGSVVGIAAGLAVALGLRELLASFGLDLPSTSLQLESRTVIVSLVAGVVVTLLGGAAPALRATRVEPVAALREGVALPGGRAARLRTPFALLLCGLGVAGVFVGLFGGGSSSHALVLLGLGAALLFLGVALLSPRLVPPLARAIAAPFVRLTSISGRLARENTTRLPGRTAVTAAALMIGVTLVTFVSVFAAGAKKTIDDAIDLGLRGQAVVESGGGQSPFADETTTALAALPGVASVSPVRFGVAKIAGISGTKAVSGIDPTSFASVYRTEWERGSDAVLRALGPHDAVVGKSLADDEHLHVGQRLRLLAPTGSRVVVTIRGIIHDKGGLLGAVAVPNRVLQTTFAKPQVDFAVVGYRKGADPVAVKRSIDRLLDRRFPAVEAKTAKQFKDQISGNVTSILGLFYALLALSIVVSLFGIVNTLVLSIHERTRELGMLRAIGSSRRQVRAMIRLEAVITALIGGVIGVVLGVVLSLLVIQKVQDFSVAIPVGSLIVVLVLAGLAGVLAAVLPARRAARLDVLRALAYE